MLYSTKPRRSNNINQSSTVSRAIRAILPELMNRNTKLGKRLKSKLKVSSLLNNIELRNQNYLKELVSSSERTLQDLKSGLDLPKAMKSSSDKLSLLNSKILNDCFMKKNNFILNTKKVLNRSTEEETNMIIKRSISVLRDCINPNYKVLESPKVEKKKKHFLSQSELNNAKMIIKNKIFSEEKILKAKIKDYLEKLKTIKLSNYKNNSDLYDYKIQKINKDKNRDFYFYAKHLYFDDNNIKMIHYKKLQPQPIRDKSCPNLENIKENIFPNIKNNEINSDNYVNINNSNGVKIINGMKFYKKFGNKNNTKEQDENQSKINYSDIVVNKKKDSFNTLKKIIIRNHTLINKSTNKFNKLSHLIDINLPKLSDYESIIDTENKKEEEEKIKPKTIRKENSIEKKKTKISNKFSNLELIKELRRLKDEIKFLKEKKIDIDDNYLKHQEELSNIVYVFEKKPIVKKKNNLLDDDGLLNRKIIADNPKMRLPSSHSVSILKRKFKINSGISNKYNRFNRNYSNHTRDRTSASTLKNSASYIITTSKSDNIYNEIFSNYLLKENKNNIINKNLDANTLFSLPQEKLKNKNNNNSSNITSMSDY